jgi:ribonucleotide monophosphatase NagD (HAD superfamily)
MAHDAEVDSCLVLTGVTTEAVLHEEYKKPYPIIPTHICWNLELKKRRDDFVSF